MPETAVFLHASSYKHRYARPKTSAAELASIVFRSDQHNFRKVRWPVSLDTWSSLTHPFLGPSLRNQLGYMGGTDDDLTDLVRGGARTAGSPDAVTIIRIQ
jgi:hypothetical protein